MDKIETPEQFGNALAEIIRACPDLNKFLNWIDREYHGPRTKLTAFLFNKNLHSITGIIGSRLSVQQAVHAGKTYRQAVEELVGVTEDGA